MSQIRSGRCFENSKAKSPPASRSDLEAPRVYILSDVRLYREGLISCLGTQTQLEIIGAGKADDFLGQVVALQPNILLLDLAAPDSLSIPRRAQQLVPGLRVVAFAVAEVEEDVLACAEAGMSGFVTQDGSTEDLIAALRCALRGELACSPRMAAFLFGRMATLCSGRPTLTGSEAARLTRREREIAALLASNLPNKAIARQLRLGPTTVKNHVHNILQKLNIHHRGDVARLQINGNRWRIDMAFPSHERLGGLTYP